MKFDTNKLMTPKMKKFADYYLETRNGARSYAKAYEYDIDTEEGKEKNYNTVAVNAYKLLQDERIIKYLEIRELEMDYERDLSDKEIMMLLNRMALGGQYRETTRLEALKMLSKMKGMYEEVEKSTEINISLSEDLQDLIKENNKEEEEEE